MSWEYKPSLFLNYHNTSYVIHGKLSEGKAITWFQEMEETRAFTSYELSVKAIHIQLEISSHAMLGGLNPKTN